jgi:hypothetical protein
MMLRLNGKNAGRNKANKSFYLVDDCNCEGFSIDVGLSILVRQVIQSLWRLFGWQT